MYHIDRLEPIELNFYDDNDEITATYVKTRLRVIDAEECLRFEKYIADNNDTSTVDKLKAIQGFIVSFYGDKFSIEELSRCTYPEDVMSCYLAIMTRCRGAFDVNFQRAGTANMTETK